VRLALLYAADPETASISALRLFQADRPVYLGVGFDTCLSSSCDRDRVASCTVTPSGAELAVTASGAWTDWSGTGEACTDDCGFLSASCATDLLPPGTYTFTLAGAPPLVLDIPSQPLSQPCTPR
jgi:hypothetical protein